MNPTIVDASANEIPRAKRYNPLGYDEEQFARRDEKVDELAKKFPTIPTKWLEYLWDSMEKRTDEEITELIKSEKWLKPVKERQMGGVLKDAMQVELFNPDKNDGLLFE
jgi:hypothetical protein